MPPVTHSFTHRFVCESVTEGCLHLLFEVQLHISKYNPAYWVSNAHKQGFQAFERW